MYVNFSEGCSRVVCSFPKTDTPHQMMQIFPNPKQGTLSGCFGFFFLKFPENLKISIYTILTERESISIFILHQFQPVLKSHISLALSSCKEIKTSSDPCKFSADQ